VNDERSDAGETSFFRDFSTAFSDDVTKAGEKPSMIIQDFPP